MTRNGKHDRYLDEIIGRSKNPYYLTIARELGDAIYLERGTKETYPRYRDHYDQETRVDEVFKKLAKIQTIWGSGAQKVCIVPPSLIVP